ncbi:hypothetical protein [Krasilnikovia sp. MM14-A1004]|uniref:hypothetical protein n=1 Tax=Krasilnikovia sp. MM14-A1004 TaxID=3373541 RepID=UPI00399D21A5
MSAINNAGTVVGAVDGRAVVWNAETGTMRKLRAVPEYPYSVAEAINASGVIVGLAASSSTAHVSRPVRWNLDGTVTLLTSEEGVAATAIGDDDEIAGWRGGMFAQRTPVRLRNGKAIDIKVSSGTGYVTDISGAGVVVGVTQGYRCNCTPHAFVTQGASSTTLTLASTVESGAAAITTDGRRIVGTADGRATVWEHVADTGPHAGWMMGSLGQPRSGWATQPTGMNGSGDLTVGTAHSGSAQIGWVRRGTAFTELDGNRAEPVDVNDGGVIAGYVTATSGAKQPVVWR